jgi:hypothetical protein
MGNNTNGLVNAPAGRRPLSGGGLVAVGGTSVPSGGRRH